MDRDLIGSEIFVEFPKLFNDDPRQLNKRSTCRPLTNSGEIYGLEIC